jgi:hypothetical protein
MHQAFAVSLGGAVSQRCGGQVGVRAKCVGVDYATFNLGTGVYDAVLVVGSSVPAQLLRAGGITLSATPEANKRDRMVFLVVGPGDESLQGLLAGAFASALNDRHFLDLFFGRETKLVAANADRATGAQ